MKLHELIQGSPEWLAYRATMRNASDAPAMMGCSPYKTRAALLREVATSVAPEVGAATQRIFDAGHRFEALARPLAEHLIGEDLYPVTGSEGRLSASFDGLTLGGELAWEHKTLNDDLRSVMTDDSAGRRLPLNYRVQMEQQLLVSDADAVLFTASKWDGEQLVEARHCWYYPDVRLREQIVQGWAQFEADLATYALPATVEPVRAAAMESLPAVSVRMDGALAVQSNLPAFGQALREFVARMPARPSTDQEFADTDAACKALKRAEEALDAAETSALASLSDVEAMRRMVADFRELARTTRLASEKLVERRKLELKEEAVAKARRALDEHVAGLNGEIAPMRLLPVPADFAGAIKGKRSLESIHDALDTALVAAKIAADGAARGIRGNLAAFKLADGLEFLFADLGTLVHKPADDFAATVQARIATHRAAEAAKESRAAAQREAERLEALASAQRVTDAMRAEVARAAVEAPTPTPIVAAPAPAPAADEPATLNLGAICTRLGFTVNAMFLVELGITYSRTDKASKLYRESDFRRICQALTQHIARVQQGVQHAEVI